MSKYRVTLYYPTYRGADHEYAPYGEGIVVEANGAREAAEKACAGIDGRVEVGYAVRDRRRGLRGLWRWACNQRDSYKRTLGVYGDVEMIGVNRED